MPDINFTIKNKRITVDAKSVLISDNTDYNAVFLFDAEWSGLVKTARFISGSTYTDVILTDDACAIPREAISGVQVYIGVFAGDLHTSTPVSVYVNASILSNTGSPAAPTPDVYAQIMDYVGETYAEFEAAVAADASAAEASKEAAETAETNAETAQAAAETAETNAETAQTAAETAQAGAVAAQTAAETAQTNAETAETNAEASATRAAASVAGGQFMALEVEDDGCLYFTKTNDMNNISFEINDTTGELEVSVL